MGTTTPTTTWVEYDDGPHPVTFKKGELDAETATIISTSFQRDDDGGIQRIYLYDDRSAPTSGIEQMEAYLERLAHLANLKLD